MNDYIYKNFIAKYIPINDRVIVNKNEMYLIGLKKKNKYKKHYLKILIHCGSPCYRYCICYLMSDDDIEELLKQYY